MWFKSVERIIFRQRPSKSEPKVARHLALPGLARRQHFVCGIAQTKHKVETFCGTADESVFDRIFFCRFAVRGTEVRIHAVAEGRQGRIRIWLLACGWPGSKRVISSPGGQNSKQFIASEFRERP